MAEEIKQKNTANTKGPAKETGGFKQSRRHGFGRAGVGRDVPRDEFESKLLDLARVTRVTGGGKRLRFRAVMAAGNKKGKVGIGIDKGKDVSQAIEKATKEKSMPPFRYWIMHQNSRLSEKEQEEILNWVIQSLEILQIQ